jgi:hypothetical protein
MTDIVYKDDNLDVYRTKLYIHIRLPIHSFKKDACITFPSGIRKNIAGFQCNEKPSPDFEILFDPEEHHSTLYIQDMGDNFFCTSEQAKGMMSLDKWYYINSLEKCDLSMREIKREPRKKIMMIDGLECLFNLM